MSRMKAFLKDRAKMLRSLDAAEFDRFCRKWQVPRPVDWAGNARSRAMHKLRLELPEFTTQEKELSADWLRANGSDATISPPDTPCPACGQIGYATDRECFTCRSVEYAR